MSFDNGKGHHVMNLMIDKDGKSGFIVDPAGIVLKFTDINKGKELLTQRIAEFSFPVDEKGKALSSHNISIAQFMEGEQLSAAV